MIMIIIFIGQFDNIFSKKQTKKYISKMRKIILKILLPIIINSHSENNTHTNYNTFIHSIIITSINIKNNNYKLLFSYYRNIFIFFYYSYRKDIYFLIFILILLMPVGNSKIKFEFIYLEKNYISKIFMIF
jgi:hypothetical protein